MSDEKKRDAKGDIINSPLPDDLKAKLRAMNYTYVWQERVSRGGAVFYREVRDEFSEEKYQIYKSQDIDTLGLFKSPENPPFDEYIKRCNGYEGILNYYFRPVLAIKPMEKKYDLQLNTISNLVIPKDKIHLIDSIISDYNLQAHRDFIFFLVAKIQGVYIDEIEYYERPEQIEQIRNLPGQVNELYNLLDIYTQKIRISEDADIPPQVVEIKFITDKAGRFTIKDHGLISWLMNAIKVSWEEGYYHNWRKQLKAYPSYLDENQKDQTFKKRLSSALHNCFKEQGFFKYENGVKIKDDAVYCIGRLMSAAGIPFISKEGIEHDISIDKISIISLIKGWIRRTEVEPQETHHEVIPDIDLLCNYFDKQLVLSIPPVHHIEEIGVAYGLCDRFDIKDETPQITHLMAILRYRSFQIGHQGGKFNAMSETIPELKGIIALLNGPVDSIKIASGGTEHVIMSNGLKKLIQDGMKAHHENSSEEFDWDLWETTIIDDPAQGSFKISQSGNINDPKDRFLPRFCKSMYSYLMHVSPPQENEYSPSKRYHAIIAATLQQAWVFKHIRTPEWVIINKVENWLK